MRKMLKYQLSGIGQQLKKRNPSDPDCCYYLHCATYDYPVTPDPVNDERNAQDYRQFYENKVGLEGFRKSF